MTTATITSTSSSNYTTSKHINIPELEYDYENEEIFELEDNDSISDISTISSINTIHQQSPLLSSTYYLQHSYNNEDQGDLLYECCICKQKMSNDTVHDCLSSLQNQPDVVIQSNNELIQSNYRKWLFNLTPKVPF